MMVVISLLLALTTVLKPKQAKLSAKKKENNLKTLLIKLANCTGKIDEMKTTEEETDLQI